MKKTKVAAKEPNFSIVILESAYDIATKLKVKEIFIIVTEQLMENSKQFLNQVKKMDALLVVRGDKQLEQFEGVTSKVLSIPDVSLSRMGQIKVSVMLALSSGIIDKGDRIVCVTGVTKLGFNDTVVIIDTNKEFEIFSSANLIDISDLVRPDVFETVLTLAMELATQGREGRSVGTIFVLGDEEKVLQLSRQMIINPFKGYSEEELLIHDQRLKEAIKEFSVIDGAFLIRGDGVLITAGRHLNAAVEVDTIPHGLGSRHMAAAGITSLTDSIAIVVSETTGSVRIFKKGNIFMEIERPAVVT
jgi:DNA integrity scanning protein DisA with diadenylate cyclase activity